MTASPLPSLDEFKAAVEKYLAETGMAPSAFGLKACGDSAFVLDMRGGREPRSRTMRKVVEFMSPTKGDARGNDGEADARVA